jgi:Na+/melibiose symporter-like transporter
MNPSVINGVLTLLGGLFISLVAYGVIPLPQDSPNARQTLQSWRTFMRIVGPLLTVWGIYLLVQGA